MVGWLPLRNNGIDNINRAVGGSSNRGIERVRTCGALGEHTASTWRRLARGEERSANARKRVVGVGASIAEIEARWLESTLVGMSGGVC